MFDWLFPNWSNPAAVAAVVGLRLLVDVGLVALVAMVTGRRSPHAVAAATLTLASVVLTISGLRPGGAGRAGSLLELSFQFVLLGIAGYVAYSNPSDRRWVAFVGLAVGALVLLLPAVVLYGEATVAP